MDPRPAPADGADRYADAPVAVEGETRAPGLDYATLALMLLPGALVVFLGFHAGGFFPSTPAIAAVVLTQALLVRLLQARHPLEGLAPATLFGVAALSAYGALTLASALWSHSTGRALIELDRVWLYLVALVLFGSVRATGQRLRWLIGGLALGACLVCLAGLISRVAPDVWPTAPDVANERLSYPVTYWNALGLLAALAILFCAHLTCSLGERRPVRVLAAALVPLLGATLFFTFSRGAIAAAAAGLLLYASIGRPRALLSGVLAAAPPSAILIAIAYRAKLLDTVDPMTRAAVAQGHRVAAAAVLCALAAAGSRWLLAARLDPSLRERRARAHAGGRLRASLLGVVAVTALAGALVLGGPHRLAHDWQRFAGGATPHGTHSDLRERLTDPSNNGRTDLWLVALDAFSASPVHGYGAGMFQTVWERRRPRFVYTVNAHSLYLQSMAELGIPGATLLLLLVGAVLSGLFRRVRGPHRSRYGVLLAAGVVWALHAGVDWDWEMPVISLPFFAAAGLALSPQRRGRRSSAVRAPAVRWATGRAGESAENGGPLRENRRGAARRARPLIGLACLATLALPVLIVGSQRPLSDAEHALYASDCASAGRQALSSIDWLDVRSAPYEVLGFCDLQRGLPRLGVEAMSRAVNRDPGSWETHYGLALAQASAGIDPREQAREALAMNPHEPLALRAAAQLGGGRPTDWVLRAGRLRAAALASNDLAIAPA